VRIGLGGIWHETNTFAPGATTLDDFRRWQLHAGDELLATYRGTGTEPGGAIAAAEAAGAEVVPLLFAGALPSGIVRRDAFDALADELVSRAHAAGQLDGVVLCLHGAMVVEGGGAPETELAERVRAAVGDVPLGVTLDLHANVEVRLADVADVLVGYTTYPHVDMRDCGDEACRLVLRMLAERRRPRTRLVKLPLLTPPQVQGTDDEPMRSVRAAVDSLKSRERIWSASFLPGFAYADVDRLGFTIYVAADDDADGPATELATAVWERRAELDRELVDPAEAVAAAVAGPAPAVLVDVADNVGGGSPGDGTALLQALLEQGATGAVVVLWDPRAVEQLYASDDEQATLDVGGRSGPELGPPARVAGRVRRPGRVEYRRSGSYMRGQHVDMGRVAVVECAAGEVVLTENRVVPFDDDHLSLLGIDPRASRILVAKGAIAWRAAFGDYAARTIFVRSPGYCPADIARVDYRERPRPLYPLEPEASWP
jgi:microcystin degradation protein MlrC